LPRLRLPPPFAVPCLRCNTWAGTESNHAPMRYPSSVGRVCPSRCASAPRVPRVCAGRMPSPGGTSTPSHNPVSGEITRLHKRHAPREGQPLFPGQTAPRVQTPSNTRRASAANKGRSAGSREAAPAERERPEHKKSCVHVDRETTCTHLYFTGSKAITPYSPILLL
jgi:hypothetical protein